MQDNYYLSKQQNCQIDSPLPYTVRSKLHNIAS